MKAIRVDAFGPPAEVVRYLEAPEPESPRQGEVLVSVEAAPINPSDLLILSGIYGALPRLPTFPGKEGVGRVESVGSDVTQVKRGDRVMLPLGAGTWRQRVTVRADEVIPAPADADPAKLSMGIINPLTAHALLHEFVKLGRGEWVVQNAASSSIGRWIIHLAKEAGLKTVNVVRHESACDPLLALGANVVLVDGAELGKRIMAATRGAQIKLVLDAVAGSATTRIAACLDHGGTVVSYGMLSGEPIMLSPNDLIFRDIHLDGFWLLSHLRSQPADKTRALVTKMLGLIASGAVDVAVEASYGLDRIRDAVAHAQRPGRNGKIVLLPNAEPTS
ncbi:zinc-dependent alcohol dehydrogenase family protein [Polyangium aurulentum]|uniref:zinc-dependent alcohol dehydrogenase family protein n=1 Tax=Polyangium aurulentum TaxID=2567896 RepID=UPI0010AEC107|nr:zinc-dependent alcohol dehydrogenase family protein [Polyangium aurulentum]UQA62179.1 zinc-dependent alcohol dehydrogenase family protein [Polyangium aurulentum]